MKFELLWAALLKKIEEALHTVDDRNPALLI